MEVNKTLYVLIENTKGKHLHIHVMEQNKFVAQNPARKNFVHGGIRFVVVVTDSRTISNDRIKDLLSFYYDISVEWGDIVPQKENENA